MRKSLALIASLAWSVTVHAQVVTGWANVTTAGEIANQSDQFTDSIGFATHIPYTDTTYTNNFQQMVTLLQQAGIRHIRDGLYSTWNQNSFQVTNYKALGAAGIDLTAISDGGSTVASIENFASLVGNLAALEGMNECDVNNCIPAAIAQLPILKQAGTALGIPVLGLSLVGNGSYAQIGNIAPYITMNTIHCYYGGRNPDANGGGWGGLNTPSGAGYAVTNWWSYQNQMDAANVPNVVTESGYLSPPTPAPYQIAEAVEASYLPRLFLENFAYGAISRTFAYEFLDEGAVGMTTDASNGGSYGVVRPDMSVKPAYTAIKNLISLTADKGKAFMPSSLQYTISGQDSNYRHLLLQKRNGSFLLIMWLEESSYDPGNNAPISVSPENLTLAISGTPTIRNLSQFDSTGAISSTSESGSTLTFSLTDQVTVVTISN